MKKLLVSFAAIALFAACSSNEGEGTGLPTGEQVALKVGGNTLLDAPANVQSKADVLTALDNGVKLGVYASLTDVTASTVVNFNYNVTNDNGQIDPNGTAPLVNVGSTYNLFAYSPYKTPNPADPAAVVFNHGEDVLWARTSLSVAAQGSAAYFAFRHKMAQVKFIVELDIDHPVDNVGQPEIDAATINITGFPASAQLNLGDGTLTPSAALTGAVTQKNTRVCVVPSAAVKTINIAIASDAVGVARNFQAELNQVLQPGLSYTFVIKPCKNVNTPNQVDLVISAQVVDWVYVAPETIHVPEII